MSGPLLIKILKEGYTELENKEFSVRGTRYDSFTDTIDILLEGDDFPEVIEGGYAEVLGQSKVYNDKEFQASRETDNES